MGDGYWLTSRKTVYLCTESFPHDDVMRFISFLEHKFGLNHPRDVLIIFVLDLAVHQKILRDYAL
jgi:hypothetical protein